MKVGFRVDSSDKIGLGHIHRTLALAKEFRIVNIEVFFLTSNFQNNFDSLITNNGFKIIRLKKKVIKKINFNKKFIKEDAFQTVKVVKKKKIDLIIIDHYFINSYWENVVGSICKIVLISDYLNRKTYADIVVSYHLGLKKNFKKFLLKKNCKLLTDAQYTIIKKNNFHKNNKIKKKSILITMGSVDSNFYTEKLVKIFSSPVFNKFFFTVLTNEKRILGLKKTCKNNKNFKFNIINKKSLYSLAFKNSVVISNMGTSMYEFSFIGSKIILIPQSYIHRKILQNIKSFNLFDFERKISNFNNPRKILNTIRTDLDRAKTRKILFDGFGAKRLAEYITMNYDSVKLTNYSNKDFYFLFNLVNQTDVRRSSFNSKEITFESHQRWIKNFMKKKSNKILIFRSKNLKIGQVRLEKKNNFYRLDYSISNEFRGMNYGSKMLKLLIKNYRIDNISASTKSNNISSIVTLKKAGFIKIQPKTNQNRYNFLFKRN